MHAVFERQGAFRYEHAMHEVWSVRARRQPGGPNGEGGSGYPPVTEDERAQPKDGARR